MNTKTTFKVNAIGGLNLRTGLCKKVKTLVNNTSLSILPQSDPGGPCKAGNKYYAMKHILYNGESYQVASFYLI